jgi:hypothetical protein
VWITAGLAVGAAAWHSSGLRLSRILGATHPYTWDNALAVKSWIEQDLVLRDGRRVPVPGVARLPGSAKALASVTRRGVQIDGAGRVWGIIRTSSGCGNSMWAYYMNRVSVGDVVRFFSDANTNRRGVSGPDWFDGGDGHWNSVQLILFHRWVETGAVSDGQLVDQGALVPFECSPHQMRIGPGSVELCFDGQRLRFRRDALSATAARIAFPDAGSWNDVVPAFAKNRRAAVAAELTAACDEWGFACELRETAKLPEL